MGRNLAASIRARLKNHADAAKEDFNLTLTRHGLERLLYRLSVSPYADRFLLKSALLLSLRYDQPHRPTRDADLLAFGSADVDAMAATFREICEIAVDDGIVFDVASVRGGEIRKAAGHGGVRIDVPARLDGARIALQVDIGFGDAVRARGGALSRAARRPAGAGVACLPEVHGHRGEAARDLPAGPGEHAHEGLLRPGRSAGR